MKLNALTVMAACALLAPSASLADEEGGGGKTCVQLNRIERTEVIDDNSILFYMRGGNIYRNHFPDACPTLGREKRFSYRVTASRLCDVDTITVLDDFGFGLTPGPTCRLGTFEPITEGAAQDLRAGPHKPLVEVERVDPVGSDNGDKAPGDNDKSADEAGKSAANEADGAADHAKPAPADEPRRRRGRRRDD